MKAFVSLCGTGVLNLFFGCSQTALPTLNAFPACDSSFYVEESAFRSPQKYGADFREICVRIEDFKIYKNAFLNN